MNGASVACRHAMARARGTLHADARSARGWEGAQPGTHIAGGNESQVRVEPPTLLATFACASDVACGQTDTRETKKTAGHELAHVVPGRVACDLERLGEDGVGHGGSLTGELELTTFDQRFRDEPAMIQ